MAVVPSGAPCAGGSHRAGDGGRARRPAVRVRRWPPPDRPGSTPRRRGGPRRRRGPRLGDAGRGDRPCVACPELAATRQHVVVGDVPWRAAPVRAGRGGAGRDGGRHRPALRREVRRAAGPAARRGGPVAAGGRRPEHREVPAAGQPHAQGARGRPVQRLAAAPAGAARPAGRRRAGPVGGEVVPGPADGARAGARPAARARRTGAVWATYHPSAAIRFGPNGAPRAGLLADLAPSRGTLA